MINLRHIDVLPREAPRQHQRPAETPKKLLAFAMLIASLGAVGYHKTTEQCESWNEAVEHLNEEYLDSLNNGAAEEEGRNDLLVETVVDRVSEMLAKDEYFNCVQVNNDLLGFSCIPQAQAYSQAESRFKDTSARFERADRAYQKTAKHVDDMRVRLDALNKNKPYFCQRKFSHR